MCIEWAIREKKLRIVVSSQFHSCDHCVLYLFSILQQIRSVSGNGNCADCGSPGENLRV